MPGARKPSTAVVLVALAGILAGGCSSGAERSTTRDDRLGPGAAARPAGPLLPELGNPGYDALAYAVDLTWLPEARGVDGTATVTLRPTERLDGLSLDYRGPEVSAVRVAGAETSFAVADQKLQVDLDPPRPADVPVEVEVSYRGRPQGIEDQESRVLGWFPTDDGVLAIGEPTGAAAWTPVNEAVDDKARWQVRLTTPAPLLGVSGGTLESQTSDAGETTTTWRVDQPMSSYLAFVTVGEFEELRDEVDGVPLLGYAQPGLDPSPAPELQGEVMGWLADLYGPYPFDVGGFVLDDSGSGLALETQTRSVFDGEITETLLVHELAHQWFGNAVTPSDWADVWLNEGFATYAEWRWRARERPEFASIASQLQGALDFYPEDFWELAPHALTSGDQLFLPQVYVRGAMTLAALEGRIGTDRIDVLLRRWVGENRYGNASSADFEALAAEVAGEELDDFFDLWLRTPGRPAPTSTD